MHLELVGRTLSQASIARIVTIASEAIALLVDAGVDPKTSLDMIDASGWLPTAAAGGSRFSTDVARASWYSRLQVASKIFNRRFRELAELSEEAFEVFYGKGVDRLTETGALVEDYKTLLVDLIGKYPPPGPNDSIWEAYDTASEPFRLSSISAGAGGARADVVPINTASIEFRCRAGTPKQLGNRSPFQGVLFRVGEISEAVPSKGPGLPLYIPPAVAEAVVSQVHGLPLDAADSLSEHADDSIVGVMLSAEITDQDFIVHGQLWPSSQGKKVSAIAASREDLGMSLTGDAIGHEAVVNEQQVFWVDALVLKGANILFSKKATFQKTRLLQASMQTPEQLMDQVHDTPIAASTLITEGDSMEIQALADQIKALTDVVQGLQADKQKQQEQLLAAEAAQAAAVQQQTMATSVADHVKQQLEAALPVALSSAMAAAINPSGQPRRLTAVPVAAGASAEDANTAIALQLAGLMGELRAVRTSGDLTRELQLCDDIRALGGNTALL